MKLNLGCGPHYAEGWWNVDVIESDEHDIHPDQIIEPGLKLPFKDGEFERVYVGHLLEHVPWEQTPYLLAELERVIEPGGKLGIVGPDVMRALDRWQERNEPFWLVEACLEDDKVFMADGSWDGARHQWNCYEERVSGLLTSCGFPNHRSLDMHHPEQFEGWPIVSFALWQFGIEVQL